MFKKLETRRFSKYFPRLNPSENSFAKKQHKHQGQNCALQDSPPFCSCRILFLLLFRNGTRTSCGNSCSCRRCLLWCQHLWCLLLLDHAYLASFGIISFPALTFFIGIVTVPSTCLARFLTFGVAHGCLTTVELRVTTRLTQRGTSKMA